MSSCVLDTCCVCIELRTGCLVIGYIDLVRDVIVIVYGLLFLAAGEDPDMQAEKATNMQLFGLPAAALGVFLLLVAFFLLAFTIVLVVGVHQNKRGHVKAYLILMYISLVLYALGLFVSFTQTNKAWELIIVFIVYILVSIYFTLVIRSHYLKMDDNLPQTYYTAPRLPALAHLSGAPIPRSVPDDYHKIII